MNYTQSIGNVNELMCLSKFIELGYECSIPYGNGAKYDFIADIDGKMLRIQCKSASRTKSKALNKEYDDAFSILTVSSTTNTKKITRHRYDNTQIDYFATYYEGQVYLIPVEECSTSKTLRFSPPLNHNKNYNKAEDYEIEKIIPRSKSLIENVESNSNKAEEIEQEEKSKEQFFCSKCGAEITKYSKSGLCSVCSAISARRVNRPTREELKELIRNKPFLQIGEMYGVSDNAIRKWCKAENLPSKKTEIIKYSDTDWSNI